MPRQECSHVSSGVCGVDFVCVHPNKIDTSTLKGSFSARHESSGGEKKPLNPVLGETFHGTWKGSYGETKLVAEQVSHHPPISAYHIVTPNGIHLEGHNGQKSGFSGRTIVVKQIGYATLTVPVNGRIERYLITFPHLSLEGLFFGSPYAELTDKSYIVSSSGWIAENEYSGKGWVSGKKNTIKTRVFEPELFAKGEKSKFVVEGQWTDSLSLRHHSSHKKDGEEVFIDCLQSPATHITDDEVGETYESRKLWKGVATALRDQDYEAASRLKSEIEQTQRDMRKVEKAEGKVWPRKYFAFQEDANPETAKLMLAVGIKPNGGYWRHL